MSENNTGSPDDAEKPFPRKHSDQPFDYMDPPTERLSAVEVAQTSQAWRDIGGAAADLILYGLGEVPGSLQEDPSLQPTADLLMKRYGDILYTLANGLQHPAVVRSAPPSFSERSGETGAHSPGQVSEYANQAAITPSGEAAGQPLASIRYNPSGGLVPLEIASRLLPANTIFPFSDYAPSPEAIRKAEERRHIGAMRWDSSGKRKEGPPPDRVGRIEPAVVTPEIVQTQTVEPQTEVLVPVDVADAPTVLTPAPPGGVEYSTGAGVVQGILIAQPLKQE
jgi:hypothetical protein